MPEPIPLRDLCDKSLLHSMWLVLVQYPRKSCNGYYATPTTAMTILKDPTKEREEGLGGEVLYNERNEGTWL